MDITLLRHYFLSALIVVSSILTIVIFRPFLVILVLATVFAVVLQPIHRRILAYMKSLPSLASGATIVFAIICILVPLTFIALRVVDEAQQLYTSLSTGGESTYLLSIFQDTNATLARYVPSFAMSEAELTASIDQYGRETLAWFLQNLGGAFGGIARLFLSFFIFVIALYYLLRDGMRLKQLVIKTSPLRDGDDEAIFTRLEGAINSVIRGSLTIALLQGVLTAVGFALFGVPNSVLWGVVAGLASLIPGIGTALVLAPAVAYLFIIGATMPAIGLLIWATVAVGMIDNFLGPKLMGKGMQLHPLLVLLSVLGGLSFFGTAGLFIGPLCISLLFALLATVHHKND